LSHQHRIDLLLLSGKPAGLSEIRLLTNEAFANNVGLYQKLGYWIDRREPFRGGVTLYMSKSA
jgi:hypothetical protein